MEQVMARGNNDAMDQISKLMKDMVTLDDRNEKLDTQYEFQLKTEIDLDEELERAKDRLEKIQAECQSAGVHDKPDDFGLYTPERVKTMKNNVEKHSIKAIHRKFYSKISNQKKKLQRILGSYNESVNLYSEEKLKAQDMLKGNNSMTMNNSQDTLVLQKHPLMREINKSLGDLKKSVPRITNKLKWAKPIWFKKGNLMTLRGKKSNLSFSK